MKFLVPLLSLLTIGFTSCSNAQNNELKGLENIRQIAEISLNTKDYEKLVAFMKDTLDKNREIDEAEFFYSDPLRDFLFAQEIFFCGYFDWKQSSYSITYHIEQSLLKNFQDSVTYEEVRSLIDEENGDLGIIDEGYEIIGRNLSKKNYLLVNIDIDCDCYMPIVVKPENAKKLERAIVALGFEYEPYDVVW